MTQNVSEILSAISQPNRVRIIKELEKQQTLCACEIQPEVKQEKAKAKLVKFYTVTKKNNEKIIGLNRNNRSRKHC